MRTNSRDDESDGDWHRFEFTSESKVRSRRTSTSTPMNSTFRLLRALTRTMQKCEWELIGGLLIRARHHCKDDGGSVCPLTFVERIAFGLKSERTIFDPTGAGFRLGFSVRQIDSIVEAADGPSVGHRQLRRILLKAARIINPP